MVEDGQHEGLQHDRLGERRLDHQDRRAGEVAVAFAVAPDVPAEAVGLQIAQRVLVHHVVVAQEHELVRPEAELLQGLEQPPGPGDHAVPAAVRESPGEHLEYGAPPRRPAAQRGGQHGELITVGKQRRAGPAGNCRHEQEDYGGDPRRLRPPGVNTRIYRWDAVPSAPVVEAPGAADPVAGDPAAPSPPSSRVTQMPSSIAATQTCPLRHDTVPTWLVVSEVTADQ